MLKQAHAPTDFVVIGASVLGSVLWISGLMRLGAEAFAAMLSAVYPNGLGPRQLVFLGLSLLICVIVFVGSFPWFRRMANQIAPERDVLAKITRLSRRTRWMLAGFTSGGVILAIALLGMVAGAIAIGCGLLIRIGVMAFAVARYIQRR